jgi:hypothetical protein
VTACGRGYVNKSDAHPAAIPGVVADAKVGVRTVFIGREEFLPF